MPSGIAAQGEADIISGGGGNLADVLTQQATTGANQYAANAATDYAGRITQRGQDLDANTALRNSILGLISAGTGAY
jgi:hypothetical protein